MIDVTGPRFPGAPAPHYESYYVRAWEPAAPRAAWIRYTTMRAGSEPATGTLWVSVFGPEGVTAFRQDGLVPSPGPAGDWITVSEATISAIPGGPVRMKGGAQAGGHRAHWDLEIQPAGAPLQHLGADLLYRAPIPRTKSTSPVMSGRAAGTVTIDGTSHSYPLAMVGHNWGSEHAHRWIWIHGANDSGDALDLVGGRLKVAGRVLPWKVSGALSLDGRRHRIGGLLARAHVDASERLCRFRVSGITGEVEAGPLARWMYEDPKGGAHPVVNSSISRLSLTSRGRTIAFPAAAYELGGGSG